MILRLIRRQSWLSLPRCAQLLSFSMVSRVGNCLSDAPTLARHNRFE
jgi:hypothetical protein